MLFFQENVTFYWLYTQPFTTGGSEGIQPDVCMWDSFFKEPFLF